MTTHVLILAGGPDPEHDVSMMSASAIAEALRADDRFEVSFVEIGRITPDDLAGMPGDVIWPALHGRYGEGGPLQRVLEADGRPFVGSGARASRRAIDKLLTRDIARTLGLAVQPAGLFDAEDELCPIDLPVVVKPVFEGSTIGLYVCQSDADWSHACQASRIAGRPTMVEGFVAGRELTVGLLEQQGELQALPIIEIAPTSGLYDYDAKYLRDDTTYVTSPELPEAVARRIADESVSIARAIGIRHLARADFILDGQGKAWFLEINTMPGFTSHSLVPMAAHAVGIDMKQLCAQLVCIAASCAGTH